MNERSIVVKFGGHAMTDENLYAAFAGDVARLQAGGRRLVIVHGGGPQISSLLGRLNIESRFVNGLRVTDGAVMEVAEMVLCGSVNKAVTARLMAAGVRAAGVSGRDGGILRARVKDPALGLVGEVTDVDAGLLNCLQDGGFVPVLAPVAGGPEGQALNVNADTAAGAVAGALKADRFVLISDVPGVMEDGAVLPTLTRTRILELIDREVITGGMIPKVRSCLHALDRGCRSALVLDGRRPSALFQFLTDGAGPGTSIVEG